MLDLHTGPSLRRARLCRGVCARELRSLRLAGLNLRNLGLRARLHYTRLGCLGIWNAGEDCRGGEHRGNEGGGEVSFKHGLHDNASHYSYQADVLADLHPPEAPPKRHSDLNRQNRHPKQAVPLTDAKWARWRSPTTPGSTSKQRF